MAALAVAILFMVFIVYEIVGGSDFKWAANWHTLSYFGYHYVWAKVLLVALPPAIYLAWVTWHLSGYIPK